MPDLNLVEQLRVLHLLKLVRGALIREEFDTARTKLRSAIQLMTREADPCQDAGRIDSSSGRMAVTTWP